MKDILRLHIPKNVTENDRKFIKMKRLRKIFRKKDKTPPNNSMQLPHDRIKPNRAYNHFVSRTWLKLPSCLPL